MWDYGIRIKGLHDLCRRIKKPQIPVFQQNKPQKPPVSNLRMRKPPRPFPWQISHRKTQSMPKTKTHTGLGDKIRGLYEDIFPKKSLIKDFQTTVESGRFTGFSRR
jgi:hypothetical protein